MVMQGKCSKCDKSFENVATGERKLEDDLYEICIICPGCETWYHSYYINDSLKQLKQELIKLAEKISVNSVITGSNGKAIPITAASKRRWLKYQDLEQQYLTEYAQFQNEIRSARGATVPEVKEDEADISTKRADTITA